MSDKALTAEEIKEKYPRAFEGLMNAYNKRAALQKFLCNNEIVIENFFFQIYEAGFIDGQNLTTHPQGKE